MTIHLDTPVVSTSIIIINDDCYFPSKLWSTAQRLKYTQNYKCMLIAVLLPYTHPRKVFRWLWTSQTYYNRMQQDSKLLIVRMTVQSLGVAVLFCVYSSPVWECLRLSINKTSVKSAQFDKNSQTFWRKFLLSFWMFYLTVSAILHHV